MYFLSSLFSIIFQVGKPLNHFIDYVMVKQNDRVLKNDLKDIWFWCAIARTPSDFTLFQIQTFIRFVSIENLAIKSSVHFLAARWPNFLFVLSQSFMDKFNQICTKSGQEWNKKDQNGWNVNLKEWIKSNKMDWNRLK